MPWLGLEGKADAMMMGRCGVGQAVPASAATDRLLAVGEALGLSF